MNLLEYKYRPPVAARVHDQAPYWDSQISQDGYLQQQVYRNSDEPECVEPRELSVQEFNTLEVLLKAFPENYSELFKEISMCIEDVENVMLHSDVYSLSVKGPIDSFYRHLKFDGSSKSCFDHIEFDLIHDFWRYVDSLHAVRAL